MTKYEYYVIKAEQAAYKADEYKNQNELNLAAFWNSAAAGFKEKALNLPTNEAEMSIGNNLKREILEGPETDTIKVIQERDPYDCCYRSKEGAYVMPTAVYEAEYREEA